MFVDVENINYSAIECDTLIKKARNKKGELTPDLALSCLRLTNHIANMKLIVGSIYAIKDKNKRLAFKDVVIAMVERRVQSESVMEKLRALAIEGGYEKDQDVKIGLRAEFLELDPNGKFEAKVDYLEHIGRDTTIICKLTGYDHTIRVIVPSDTKVEVDEIVRFSQKRMFVFEAETGERIK